MDSTGYLAIAIVIISVLVIMLSRRRVQFVDLDDSALDHMLDSPPQKDETGDKSVPVIFNITPEQLDRIRKRSDVSLVDIRQPFEHRSLPPIPGSSRIPLFQLRTRTQELDPDKNTVAICLSGHRSVAAGRTLIRNGFHRVFQLKGGMSAWAAHHDTEHSHD